MTQLNASASDDTLTRENKKYIERQLLELDALLIQAAILYLTQKGIQGVSSSDITIGEVFDVKIPNTAQDIGGKMQFFYKNNKPYIINTPNEYYKLKNRLMNRQAPGVKLWIQDRLDKLLHRVRHPSPRNLRGKAMSAVRTIAGRAQNAIAPKKR